MQDYQFFYNFKAPLKIGTGILKLLKDDEEDLITEESQEGTDHSHFSHR